MRVHLLVLLLLVATMPVIAADAPSGNDAPQIPAPDSFPGISSVSPRATELAISLEKLKSELSNAASLDASKSNQNKLRKQLADLTEQISKIGPVNELNATQANLFRDRAVGLLQQARRQSEALESRFQSLSQTQRKWQKTKDYWSRWETALKTSQPGLDLPGFSLAQDAVEEALALLKEPTRSLSQLQEESGRLRFELETLVGQLEARLGLHPGDLAKRTEIPMTRSSFWKQLTPDLWQQAFQQVREALRFNPNFLGEKGWLLSLQLVLTVLLARLISHYRRREGDKPDWEFLTHHPWASAGLILLAALSPLYRNPSPLWQLILWACAAVFAILLAVTLLKNHCKTALVALVAVLALSVRTLDFLFLPEPVYRLALGSLSLAAFPLLWVILFRYQRTVGNRRDLFVRLLKMGLIINGVSLLSQIGGYQAFGTLLLRATLQSLLIGLMALMLIRLLRGGIELATERAFFESSRFFRRFGQDLSERLNTLILIVVLALTLFSLLPLWGLADGPTQAWERLMGFGIQVGEFHLTVQIIFSVLLAFYLAFQVSWLLQGLLETETFYRTKIERGVRDAFKRLCHYGVMLVGFLAAMNLAGIEMRHFAVVAGAFGIGIGFGLQNIVNNFVSGIILLFERPVKVGDMVVQDGEFGSIRKIGLRSTVIETWNHAELIVPNSQLVSEKVTNWTMSTAGARVDIPVGVSYGSDIDKVLAALLRAAKENPKVLEDPPSSPIFVGFGDSSLDFVLRVWISSAFDQIQVRSEVGQAIIQNFRQDGIEIPFPQRDLHLRSVSPGTLPGTAPSDR